jgi:hypothetical protein
MLKPLETNLRVGVSRVGAYIVLSGGRKCSLITSVGGS